MRNTSETDRRSSHAIERDEEEAEAFLLRADHIVVSKAGSESFSNRF